MVPTQSQRAIIRLHAASSHQTYDVPERKSSQVVDSTVDQCTEDSSSAGMA